MTRSRRAQTAEMHVHSHDHAHENHDHGGHHGHDHARSAGRRALIAVLTITAAFMIAEFVGGVLSNSLALVADAAHMLTDVAAIGLSLFALWFARRPASERKTYGYARIEIIAALANGATLIVLAVLICVEAVQRLHTPALIDSTLMLWVAVAGLAANIAAAFILHSSAGHNLNLRGAYLHVLGDLLGSVAAIGAALVIRYTGFLAADPIISFVVAILIMFGSWKLVRESLDILLEAVPSHIRLEDVHRAIADIHGVQDVHDLHVWTVTSGFLAMSGHVVVQDLEQHQPVLFEIHRRMRERFHIQHATIQVERGLYSIRETRLPE